MINLIKNHIKGKKEKTICYEIPNIRLESNYLKWDEFTFYSPAGDFVVSADQWDNY
jgi:hypothetical protein